MSPDDVLKAINDTGIVPQEQQTQMAEFERNKPFSLHWELRSLLYIGILLLSSGLGLLVYDNFDSIGHGALLTAMAIGCGICFFFAWRYRADWTPGQTVSRSPFGDYALLLGCLLFLTLEGYAQYAYTVFGNRYGLVTLLPALLFLPMAYRFDHRGVLGMALTALISWVGVSVRPLELYFKTNFFNPSTVFSAIGLALVLIGGALLLEKRRIKPHFTETYLTIGGNLLLVALLGGLFNFDGLRLWFVLGLAVTCFVSDQYARRRKAFLFLLMSTVYGYIGATYLVFHYLLGGFLSGSGLDYWYFILTGIVLIAYLLRQLPKRNTANESI
ncbi:DUF2157 domain-containing protein [Spirosoma utsteinense]|uniref:DUF2157 domain-containing protein n=1 Tax=Spirosoma utsteinense TaxID=2585773 RepID=A0ABR6W871_9BACT|nr:DUF2157 domain-containing protein [Spirosoma utsteinense]MBC3784146.1 hypothetical protein [Spirosoma utsteinense]MBC3792765.1 hypothetical protein [Spirosoma utsteinense]